MSEIASAFVRIRPNTAGFESETKSGVMGAIGSLAKLAAAGFAAKEAFDFGKEIVQGAAQLQKSTETIQSQFGAASDAVSEFGEKGAAALGISAQTADATSARFGILFHNLGIGQGKAAEMTVGFEKLTGSLSAIRGVDPSETMNKIVLAAAGNTRGLKQLGIAISDTQIKQEALKLGLTSSIKDALTPASKAQAIYALSTQHLAEFQKDAEAHSGDLVNVQRRLSAEWSNAKDQLGAGLLPVMSTLVSALADVLPGAMRIAGEAAHVVADQVRSAWSSLAPIFDPIVAAVREVVAAFRDGGISEALSQIKESFEKLSVPAKIAVGVIAALAAQFTFALAAALPLPLLLIAVGEGLKVAYDRSATFRRVVGEVSDFLKTNVLPVLQQIAQFLVVQISGAVDVVRQKWPQIQQIFHEVITAVVALWDRFGGTITRIILTAIQTVENVIREGFRVVEAIFSLVIDLLTGKWGKAWADLKQIAAGTLGAIAALFRGYIAQLGNIAALIGDAIGSKLQAAWDAIVRAAYKAVLAILEPFSHLPGVMGGWARKAKEAVTAELEAMKDPAINAAVVTAQAWGQNFVATAAPFVQALAGQVQTALGGVSQTIAAGATGAISIQGAKMKAFIVAEAKKRNLDIKAVLQDIGFEGGFEGKVGDGGHAFGPFQLNNAGGKITKMFPGKNNPQAQAFANSKQGIKWALDSLAASAGGLSGMAAVSAIANWEAPKDTTGRINAAMKAYFAGAKDTATVLAADTGTAAADALSTAWEKQIGTDAPAGKKAKAKITELSRDVTRSFLVGLTPLPANLATKFKDALESGRRAVAHSQKTVTADFQKLGTESIAAFDGATKAGLDKMKSAFDAKIRETITIPQRNALRELDAQNKGILAGLDTAQKALTPTEQQISDLQRQHDADAQAARLAELQQSLSTAQTGGDPEEVKRAQQALDDELFAERIVALQAQADIERAARDASIQQQRDDQATTYQDQQDATNAKFDALKEGLQREYDTQVQHYQDLRDQQKTNLEAQLTELAAQLAKHPEEWGKVHKQVMDLFKGTFGPDFKTAGKNVGEQVAAGIRASFKEVRDAANDLADEIAKHLPHSPAEVGPLSKPINWKNFLLDGLEPGMMGGALSEALGLPAGDAVRLSMLASGAANAQARRDEEHLAEMRRHSDLLEQIVGKSDFVNLAVSGGDAFSTAAIEAKR